MERSFEELRQVNGIGQSNAFGVKLFQAISEKYAKVKMPKKIPLTSPRAVVDYLKEKGYRAVVIATPATVYSELPKDTILEPIFQN